MLRYMTSGESHGPQLTAIVSGLPAGLPVRAADIDRDLHRRQGGYGRGGRMAIEHDVVRIVSGVRHGFAMGSPITLIVENRDWKSWQAIMSAEPVEDVEGKRAVTRPRPGHADLAGIQKFAHTDARNILERASARATTTQVAVGALCKALLAEFGIRVGSHVTELGHIKVSPELIASLSLDEIERRVEASELRVADPSLEAEMKRLIDSVKADGDTVGGVFEVIATGVPSGLGNVMNWDERLDGRIGQAFMALQAIKGVEIGLGFEGARRPGSEAHDPILYSEHSADWPEGHGPSGGFYRKTNGAGGIEGGMSNGEPIVVRAAMKPIATLMRSIQSVDFATRQPFDASKERSDVCAVPAAAVIGESLLAIVLAQAFLEKFGADSLVELKRNYEGYIESLG
ncbi:chorismate synthase [bacterium]|nr:chorismate synthase [bacterium]